MKAPWETVNSGMNQLFFRPFLREETAYDRAKAIEIFLEANGWTWDEVIDMIAKEPIDGQSAVRN